MSHLLFANVGFLNLFNIGSDPIERIFGTIIMKIVVKLLLYFIYHPTRFRGNAIFSIYNRATPLSSTGGINPEILSQRGEGKI